MGTKNQSPSYLKERQWARRLLLSHPDAKIGMAFLKDVKSKGKLSDIFNDEKQVDWEALVEDTINYPIVVRDNREAVEAIAMARNSNSLKAAPTGMSGRWRRVAQIPQWYLMRRMIEEADTEYWNSKKNFLKEVLEHPGFATVPLDMVRSEYNSLLPKGKKIDLNRTEH